MTVSAPRSVALAELVDGMPRELGSNAVAEDAEKLRDNLARSFPDADVRLRETGRYIAAEVRGAQPPAGGARLATTGPAIPITPGVARSSASSLRPNVVGSMQQPRSAA